MKSLRLLIAAVMCAFGSVAAADDCPAALNFEFKKLASKERVNLCQAYQGKVVLVVNTASKCGYTYQYDGLEGLYKKYKGRGLVVVGFPSNDFAGQEPDNEKNIAKFCKMTYGVNFPMFEKSHVRGADANPLYQHLKQVAGAPGWNFHKYLINREGQVVKSFSSRVEPQSREMISALESLIL